MAHLTKTRGSSPYDLSTLYWACDKCGKRVHDYSTPIGALAGKICTCNLKRRNSKLNNFRIK